MKMITGAILQTSFFEVEGNLQWDFKSLNLRTIQVEGIVQTEYRRYNWCTLIHIMVI